MSLFERTLENESERHDENGKPYCRPVKGIGKYCDFSFLSLKPSMDNCCGALLYGSYVLVRAILRVIWVIANNLYCFPTHALWMLTLFPLKKCKPHIYWKIEGMIYHWMIAMVGCWSWTAGYDVVEVGDDVTRLLDETTLVIANHQSTADVPLLMACFNAKNMVLDNLMWIMDSIFKYTSFGIVSYFHEDFFILSGPESREAGVQLLRRHLEKVYKVLNRKWLILFPEGGFLHKRKEASNRYLQKNAAEIGFSELEHVTLPRTGAMEAIMETLAPPSVHPNEETLSYQSGNEDNVPNHIIIPSSEEPSLKYVLDITIAYPDKNPLGLFDIVTGIGKPRETYFFYRIFETKTIPHDSEGMKKWLYELFKQKDEILQNFYDTGRFPVDNGGSYERRRVQQDNLKFVILHCTFIVSSYMHYCIFSYLYSLMW